MDPDLKTVEQLVEIITREVLTAGPDHGALRAAVGALNGSLTG